jgi:ABC-type Fe3+-hydroxamate transport system substrate-binding protein
MRKWWLLLVGLALWSLLGYTLAASRSADSIDTASAASNAARIVSVAPNLTEILYALGLEEAIVGVTAGSDYPPSALDKPKVGTFWQPNIEAIIALRPSLVVTLGFAQQKSLVHRLKRMGCPCLTTDIWTVGDLFATIDTLGKATASEQQAQKLIDVFRLKTLQLEETLQGRQRPRVLWVVQREPLRVAGRDTFINELIELAGGQNAIGPTLHKYPPIGAEQVIASNPQVVIEPTMVKGDPDLQRDQALAYWDRYANIPAVANERIHIIDGDIVSRLGPRLSEGIETIAQCLHPNVLGD